MLTLQANIYSHEHQRLAATCHEEIVIYDYKKGKRVALMPQMMDVLAKAYDVQEKDRAEVEVKLRKVYDLFAEIDAAIEMAKANKAETKDNEEERNKKEASEEAAGVEEASKKEVSESDEPSNSDSNRPS